MKFRIFIVFLIILLGFSLIMTSNNVQAKSANISPVESVSDTLQLTVKSSVDNSELLVANAPKHIKYSRLKNQIASYLTLPNYEGLRFLELRVGGLKIYDNFIFNQDTTLTAHYVDKNYVDPNAETVVTLNIPIGVTLKVQRVVDTVIGHVVIGSLTEPTTYALEIKSLSNMLISIEELHNGNSLTHSDNKEFGTIFEQLRTDTFYYKNITQSFEITFTKSSDAPITGYSYITILPKTAGFSQALVSSYIEGKLYRFNQVLIQNFQDKFAHDNGQVLVLELSLKSGYNPETITATATAGATAIIEGSLVRIENITSDTKITLGVNRYE